MAYRNKEDCIKEAERLGIDVTNMDWRQLQKAVSDGLKREALGLPQDAEVIAPAGIVEQVAKARANKVAKSQVDKDEEALQQLVGKTVLLSPELAPERYRLIKYDEELGNEVEVEERKFDINRETDQVYDMSGGSVDYENQIDTYHDYNTGTYRIKKRSDRKVVGMASVPKENPGLSFRPGIDLVTVVSFKGKHGYLWKHWRYPNVMDLLKQAGDEYYQKYRKVFKDSPNVWYACGHLVCDPYLVHQVIKEIEEDARRKHDMENARKEAIKRGVSQW